MWRRWCAVGVESRRASQIGFEDDRRRLLIEQLPARDAVHLRAQISDDELLNAVLREHPDATEELEQMGDLEVDEDELYEAFNDAA